MTKSPSVKLTPALGGPGVAELPCDSIASREGPPGLLPAPSRRWVSGFSGLSTSSVISSALEKRARRTPKGGHVIAETIRLRHTLTVVDEFHPTRPATWPC